MAKADSVKKLESLYEKIKENDLSWCIEDYTQEIEEAIENSNDFTLNDLKLYINDLEAILAENTSE